MIIKSDFAILDVKHGKGRLFKHFSKTRPANPKEGIGYRPVNPPIKVVIEAEIVDIYGNDDGISREFELSVKKVHVVK